MFLHKTTLQWIDCCPQSVVMLNGTTGPSVWMLEPLGHKRYIMYDAFDDAFSRTTQSRQDVYYTPFWMIQNPFLLICIVLLGWRSLCVSWDPTVRDVMARINVKAYAISICLKCRHNIFYGPLNQYATDKSKALSARVLCESFVQRGEDKSLSV